MPRRALSVLAIGAAASTSFAAVLWDTGEPHYVVFNGNYSYLGFTSGNLGSGTEQVWSAVPFRIAAGGAVIEEVDVDGFVDYNPDRSPATLDYIIWHRVGLAGPVDGDQALQGSLGAYTDGENDTRIGFSNNALHRMTGLSIAIPAGDYYLTVFGAGRGAGNTTSVGYFNWYTGAEHQDPALEWDGMWRSQSFPSPGFAVYNPSSIQAPTNGTMPDPLSRWNPSFALIGTPVPEPSSLLVAVIGSGFGLLRRRRR